MLLLCTVLHNLVLYRTLQYYIAAPSYCAPQLYSTTWLKYALCRITPTYIASLRTVSRHSALYCTREIYIASLRIMSCRRRTTSYEECFLLPCFLLYLERTCSSAMQKAFAVHLLRASTILRLASHAMAIHTRTVL